MPGRTQRVSEPSPTWTVAKLLDQFPGAAVVFTRHRMACAGCVMAPFETLAEAAAAYKRDPRLLLAAIRASAGASRRAASPEQESTP